MTDAAHAADWHGASSHNVAHLTLRELEVLAYLSSGKTNREIARALFIATGTVKNHLRSIYSKLGVSNRTEAAMVTFGGLSDIAELARLGAVQARRDAEGREKLRRAARSSKGQEQPNDCLARGPR